MSGDSILPKLPTAGDLIGDKYEVIGILGRGGMGVVFEADHRRINQRVAVKMLHPHVREEPGVIERFEREARAAGQLRSPHIARVLDVETNTELPYIVMEFLEGNDLDDELAVHGQLPIHDAVDYVLQALVGIREAHGLGIIHRDLKPANLFRCTDGPDGPIIKVLDFGISKITTEHDGRLTAAMTTLGSPVYMSPEQLRDGAQIDARADLWALGVVLFELISGRPPHAGTVTGVTASIIADRAPPLSGVRSDVPPELDAVLDRALQKNVEARFQDVESFAEALLPFASPEGAKRAQAALAIIPAPPSSRRLGIIRAALETEDFSGMETRHSFTTASHARPTTRSALWIALGAVTLGVVLGLAVFLVARGAKRADAPPTAQAGPASSAMAVPPATATAEVAASPSPAPAASVAAKPAVAPAPRKPAGAWSPRPKPKPPAAPHPAAAPVAKNPLRL